jgi:hypothetical protein
VIVHLGYDAQKYPEHWQWIPSRGRFQLVEPND